MIQEVGLFVSLLCKSTCLINKLSWTTSGTKNLLLLLYTLISQRAGARTVSRMTIDFVGYFQVMNYCTIFTTTRFTGRDSCHNSYEVATQYVLAKKL